MHCLLLQKIRGRQTRQGTDLVLVYSDRLSPLKLYDHFITWHTSSHVKIWKICISIIKRLMASKTGRVLTYVRDSVCKFLSRHQLFVICKIKYVLFSILFIKCSSTSVTATQMYFWLSHMIRKQSLQEW